MKISFQTRTEERNMNKMFIYWRTALIFFVRLTNTRRKNLQKRGGEGGEGGKKLYLFWFVCKSENKHTYMYFKMKETF